MHQENTLKRISITELIPKENNWSKYSRFHDEFLEELSYERQKFCGCDIWQLHYI